MGFEVEARPSDSPYVQSVMHGWTVASGSSVRPAEMHWHMCLVRHEGTIRFLVVGPWSKSGIVHYGDGAEILWIKFRLGTFMPHLPTRNLLDCEMLLPQSSDNRFCLKGATWEVPNAENAETFIHRLVREEILVSDPVVNGLLQGQLKPETFSPRTLRYRFAQATGLTQGQITQVERAQKAVALLEAGKSILDTVEEAGYFDQPHLTRSLKQFMGYTPAQLLRSLNP